MSKSLTLSILACFALTGCALFHKSPTWDKVVETRIALPHDGEASRIYAEGLHHKLKAARVEHKVVTYQYRYDSRLREDAVAERTAVIYRDDSNATYPWWIKDERSGRPAWLPNGDLRQQIRFYVGREVELIDPQTGVQGDGKEFIPIRKREYAIARVAPSGVDSLFREAHGTSFNSMSELDREKMSALLRTRNATASLRTF